jgi:predicted metallopeptidase
MGRLWQETLGIPAVYCIEVISEKFDTLPKDRQIEVLFHELAHIPKNFSGALLPHTRHHKGSFHDKLKGFLSAYKKR